MSSLRLPIRSVNVGLPQRLGTRDGAPVISGIAKRPVPVPTIELGEANLAGDGQADLSVHGGRDKAVYAYSTVHWPAWEMGHGLAPQPGTFGENLTLEGAREEEIHIGDVFAWGNALLVVSQPRQPCYKLNLYLGRDDIAAALTRTLRSGFYLRVLRQGSVPTTGAALLRVTHAAAAPTVRTMFDALLNPKLALADLEALEAAPGLAQAWRDALQQRILARLSKSS